MRRRAIGLRPVPTLSSRPFGGYPSRTFAPAAQRLPPGESPAGYPRRAGLAPLDTTEPAAPDRPGQRPVAWAVPGGYAGACCGRLCECVPSTTLGAHCPCCHEGRFTDGRSALLGTPHRAFSMTACMG